MVPVIYLTVMQRLNLKTAAPTMGHCATESCNTTQQWCVRLLTLVNGTPSGKPIALGPFEC